MNRLEHLLTIAAEECAEVSQRISKAARFGLSEVQADQPHDNAERIRQEVVDLYAVLRMVEVEADLLDGELSRITRAEVEAKQAKVERYLLLSLREGTLDL